MGKFNDLQNSPECIWRNYCISHAVTETLLHSDTKHILDLGCNIGSVLLDIERILPGAVFTGVDHVNYLDNMKVDVYDFFQQDVKSFVMEGNKCYENYYDLTICSWILVHLKLDKKKGHFYKKLCKLSKYLVTFENEIQMGYKPTEYISSKEIRHDTFRFNDQYTYELRVFENC